MSKKLLVVFLAMFAGVSLLAQPTITRNLGRLSQHLLFTPDNTYDIGASGATRPRNVYAAGQGIFGGVVVGSSVYTGSLTFGTAGSSTTLSAPSDGQFAFANNAGTAKVTATVPTGNTAATLPVVVGTTGLLSAQGANIALTTIPGASSVAAGLYDVCAATAVTRAATTSSTLPAVGIGWNNGVAQTATLLSSNTGNTTTTLGLQGAAGFANGCITIRAAASTAITYTTTGYATSGATSMQYELYVTVRAIY